MTKLEKALNGQTVNNTKLSLQTQAMKTENEHLRLQTARLGERVRDLEGENLSLRTVLGGK